MTASLNLDVPRNGHFVREFTVYTQDESVFDLTGATVASRARDIPGGYIITDAAIVITEASAGKFEMTWTGSDFDAFGSATEIARPSYDIRITKGGISLVPLRGFLNILPENTP